ncbi:MAG: MFS transporter [Alphaproteobacteria bacterium]|nr:MFS transporter [Alphaproteobacteria bacterium]
MASPARSYRGLPRGIWALGFVSLFMDVSSEMIHALLPVYLVAVLGMSMTTVGLIEGIAEAAVMVTRLFSGALSDWLGRRKLLAAAGYGLAAFTKPVFALATTVGWFVGARFLDRVGKGIRGAPRDALVADLAPPELRGASFGLRQSLDTVGAALGPLLAVGLMLLTANSFRVVFWVAVLPAMVSFALIAVVVKEPGPRRGNAAARVPLRLADARRLPGAFWAVSSVSALFALARFSEAFLVLRAQGLGLPVALVPLVLVVMNVVYALAAYPAGALSDRVGRHGVVLAGVVVLIAADMLLAFAGGTAAVLVGVALWGLHMGLTQGLFASLIADAAPAELRGTAFGIYSLVGGVAILAASVLAGMLWDLYGARTTFLAGAVFTALTLGGLVLVWRKTRQALH